MNKKQDHALEVLITSVSVWIYSFFMFRMDRWLTQDGHEFAAPWTVQLARDMSLQYCIWGWLIPVAYLIAALKNEKAFKFRFAFRAISALYVAALAILSSTVVHSIGILH